VKVAAAVSVPVPPSALWERLLDWEDQPRWMVDAARVSVLTPHREGLGVRVAVRTRILGIPLLTDTLEVIDWEPPARLVMVRRGVVRGRGEWRLQPAAHGTRFTWSEELAMPIPLLGELALLLYRPLMRRLMRRSLSNLARVLR
jgi:uncharacterized protein YndB with AHSA1/START domain